MYVRESDGRKALTRAASLVIVLIIVVAAVAVGVYFVSTGKPVTTSTTSSQSSSSSSTSTSTSSSSTSTSVTGTLPGPSNKSELVVLETNPPNSIDPATGFSTGEDEIMTNVYQNLVMPNYTSTTQLAPILAQSWTVKSNYTVYTFSLRTTAYFTNGDAFNASSVWFNFYRTIVINNLGASYYTNLLYNGSLAFATGFAVPNGLIPALQSVGYSISTTNATLAQKEASADLAVILSNFHPANSTVQKIMSYPNQAVTVIDQYTVQFNLVQPYLYLPQALDASGGGIVDPAFVDAHGGVAPNTVNTYLTTNVMGTGPYVEKSSSLGEFFTMEASPSYWATKLPASQSNIMLTTPKIPVIEIEYISSTSSLIQGIGSNTASLLEGPPISQPSPIYLSELASTPGVQVDSLSSAPKFLYLLLSVDTQRYPYNITNVRIALADAINYSQIMATVTESYGVRYVGPITPGLNYYNPGNLQPYAYDPSQSIQLLKALGFKLNLPNGTTINPSGTAIDNLNMLYPSNDPAESKVAQELQLMFADIGLQATLDPVASSAFNSATGSPPTSSGFPSLLFWYWYPAWLDPVYQDMVVQVNSQYPGIAGDISYFDNATVNSLTNGLPFETNPAQINATVAKVYNMVYQQVPYIWLYALVPYWVQRSYLAGVFYNAAILGFYFPLMYYNTP